MTVETQHTPAEPGEARGAPAAPTASPSLGQAIGADVRFCRELCGGSTYQALASYGLYPTVVYRFGRAAGRVRPGLLRWLLLVPYHLLRVLTELAIGISIARTADIGVPIMFHHHGGVFIAAGARLGRRCQVYQGVTIGESGGRLAGRPVLGDDVIVGAGAKILGRVHIGTGAKIGANAVVLSDVPDGALAVGIPATNRVPHQADADDNNRAR